MFKNNAIRIILMTLALTSLHSCSLLSSLGPFGGSHSNNTLRVMHYNIFELDTEKIKDLEQAKSISPQLLAVKEVLGPYDFHLLSVNEIQYDREGIPFPTFHSEGVNLSTFTKWLRPDKGWDFHFAQANTGNKAKKIAKNSYATSSDQGARFYADPNNYGLFPGQYSTGLATRYPIKKRIALQNLKWSEFNPKVKLSSYRNGQKEKLPKDISLFDKVFMDTVIEVNHKLVHVITFHTVPAYHFGNKRSPNYQRNLDQLRFLEWYLTGKTDIATKESYGGLTPLKDEDIYMAMGDWNTDINSKNPGSAVLKRFAQTDRIFPAHSITWEGPSYDPKRMSMRLDYIFYSRHLKLANAQVVRPQEKRVLLGCGKNSLPSPKTEPGRVKVSYTNRAGETCHVSINKKFKTVKDASDHFPLWAEFKFQ